MAFNIFKKIHWDYDKKGAYIINPGLYKQLNHDIHIDSSTNTKAPTPTQQVLNSSNNSSSTYLK